MASPLNGAAPVTPVVAVALVSVAPAGPDAIVAVTTTPCWLTGLPLASCSCTAGCGVNAIPLCALAGASVAMKSLLAAPTVMLNALLVWPVRPVLEAANVYPVPALSMLRVEKLATPFTAGVLPSPDRVPPPGFVPMASVTPFVALGTRLLNRSRISTCTAGVMVAPAAVFVGCVTYERLFAAAELTVTAGCCAIATPPTVADTVLVSALVELKVPVATPLASVTATGWVTVFPVVGAAASTTAFPLIGLPY